MSKKRTFLKLKKKLLLRQRDLLNELEEKHQETSQWLKDHKKDLSSLSRDFAETAATSAATGILLLASGSIPLKPATLETDNPIVVSQTTSTSQVSSSEDVSEVLAEKLEKQVPGKVRDLNEQEKADLEKIISETTGVAVKSNLEGYQLNTNYGYIGGEQHLYRFAGDNLIRHVKNAREWLMFGRSGIAPNRGAWGYFPNEDFERYYVAVQTFLSPNWRSNPKATYDWFRFRKVMVINPKSGQAVVTVVGDAGPADWTGKHYGGSPEVMHYLGLGIGPRKGAVLMFFVDDKEGRIPLGPVSDKFFQGSEPL